MVTANFPMQGNIDVVKVAALWMAEFKTYDDKLMMKAMQSVLGSNRHWPTVADISCAIKESKREIRIEPQMQYLNPRSNEISPAAAKAIEMVKKNKMKEYLKEVDVESILGFARAKYPFMPHETAKKFFNEIHTCMQSQERCKGCMWDYGYCDTNGFYYDLYIRPDGQVTIAATMCKKHPLYGQDLRKSRRR